MKRAFKWPKGKRAVVSFSFDDARASQITAGIPILEKRGVRGTFYVSPGNVEQRLDDWRRAYTRGHEIGNHTISHPCTGNFSWSRSNALEDYTLPRMAKELDGASDKIERWFGLRPATFAYPCGQTFVGRGKRLKSYVPLVASRFLIGRAYLGSTPHDPARGDLAQALSISMDRRPFKELKWEVDRALALGAWLIFVGHEVGPKTSKDLLTTWSSDLDAVCRYVTDPKKKIWVDTVAAVGTHVSG